MRKTIATIAVLLGAALLVFAGCASPQASAVSTTGLERIESVSEYEATGAQTKGMLEELKEQGLIVPASGNQETSTTLQPLQDEPTEQVLEQAPPSIHHEDHIATIENLQSSFNTVVRTVLPSVVEINVTAIETRPAFTNQGWPWFFDSDPYEQEYESNRLGSGVIFRQDGQTFYILTNDHVAADADSIEVVLDDGRTYAAELTGTDARRDLAIVSFTTEEQDIPIATLGSSDELSVGDWVLAMGSPFGYVSSVTAGIVSALGRSGRDINNINDFIQTDAAINSGNSGGPLVNIYGEVVGINTWIAAPSGGSIGLGFAIPINNAKLIIDELIEFGRAVDGWLGISMLDMDQYEALLNESEPADVKGVFVANVYLDSPAYKGGLRAGDIIIGFNQKREIDLESLSRFISDAPLGKEQVFIIYRDGQQYKATVTLEQRKTDQEISGDSQKLWPGVVPVELNEQILSSLNLRSSQKGVMIQLMTSSSETNRFKLAGMQNYDIITDINGKSIETLGQFYQAVSDEDADSYDITYIRNGKIYTTGVTK